MYVGVPNIWLEVLTGLDASPSPVASAPAVHISAAAAFSPSSSPVAPAPG